MNAFISIFGKKTSAHIQSHLQSLTSNIQDLFTSNGFLPTCSLISDSDSIASHIEKTNKIEPKFNLAVVGTGGSEGLILNYVQQLQKSMSKKVPLLLFSHPDLNSLPAALETRAKLVSDGFPTYLFHMPEKQKLMSLFKVLKSRIELDIEKRQLGIIGEPSDWLVASNMQSIKGRTSVWGIKFNSHIIPLQELIDSFLELKAKPELAVELANEIFDSQNPAWIHINEKKIKGELNNNVLVSIALKNLLIKYNLFGVTVRCFELLQHNVTGCLALSYMNDIGTTAACEGDIPSLITMQIMRSLTKKPSFMANPIHFENNSLFLAHCTAPRKILSDYILRTHFESGLGVAIAGNLANEDEPWTISRVNLYNDTVNAEKVKIKNVPWKEKSEKRCRTQVEVIFESREKLNRFLNETSGNHHILTHGDLKDEISQYAELFGTQ